MLIHSQSWLLSSGMKHCQGLWWRIYHNWLTLLMPKGNYTSDSFFRAERWEKRWETAVLVRQCVRTGTVGPGAVFTGLFCFFFIIILLFLTPVRQSAQPKFIWRLAKMAWSVELWTQEECKQHINHPPSILCSSQVNIRLSYFSLLIYLCVSIHANRSVHVAHYEVLWISLGCSR